MSKDAKLHPTLHSALRLDGSTAAIKKFYADWAVKYNQDTLDWKYAAPGNALLLLNKLADTNELGIDPIDKSLKIMDAGCGTGLLAKMLEKDGFTNIHGFDISEEMVEIAVRTGIYKELKGNIDINAPVEPAWRGQFDCTISTGVFTPGHVPPEALYQLAALTRPGGIIIVSTRVTYYESENFQATSDRMETEGVLELVHSLKNATYIEDEKAHYFIYVVVKS
jgi:2-polyprenyl-3-methyl-5-hydroxy-6-metoxy-1,4-benzoquinol methylase